jgi:hypothetical protein
MPFRRVGDKHLPAEDAGQHAAGIGRNHAPPGDETREVAERPADIDEISARHRMPPREDPNIAGDKHHADAGDQIGEPAARSGNAATTVMLSAGVRVGATLAIDWPIVSTKPRLPPRSPGATLISLASPEAMRSAGRLIDYRWLAMRL